MSVLEVDLDLEGGEAVSANIFSSYQCSVHKGQPHPGDIAEAASLRWVVWKPLSE